MNARIFPVMFFHGALWFSGCAAPPGQPDLPSDHPASPAATESPLPEPSLTLLIDGRKSMPASAPSTAALYTCPRHKQIVSKLPGTCPICKMKLVPIAATTQHDHGGKP